MTDTTDRTSVSAGEVSNPSQPLVTRFAPSPTGHLHIGGARTALFCWAFARRSGGRFMIRIEDTDQARSSEESARGILEDLAWLGIEWDDGPVLELKRPGSEARRIGGDARGVGPFFQAQRVPIYDAYAESLVRAGRAYPAFESSEDLETQRKAAIAAKQTYRYERPADVTPGVFNEARWSRACSGEKHVIRFLSLHEPIVVQDEILGDVRIAPGELDDFVIRKADGFPTYHFAVVIDDELMGVTHVLRAQEHLANTPRHVAMQRALVRLPEHGGPRPFQTPRYGHMPLIFNMDSTKMSKRDKAKAARAAVKQMLSSKQHSLQSLGDALRAFGGSRSGMATPESAAATAANFAAQQLAAFVAGDVDYVEVAETIAACFAIKLPEVNVYDFRRSGYLPEAIINFLGLLGWNPGMKLADGKDLEKFDQDFLATHFGLERIGRTSAKFDRNKLLSFNADAIAAMPAPAFVDRWRSWLSEFEPAALAKLQARNPDALALMAPSIKPRAKTFSETLKPLAFALMGDAEYAFDPAAVSKALTADGGAGISILRSAREALAACEDWTPSTLHSLIENLARDRGFVGDKGVNVGPVAQPIRVAIAGVAVTPPLGESLALLGKASTLARIDRCLASV
ncbi:MAG: glutamate--tRNA ligase family protein [Planctomycetota bacterium]|nr:glutamate--tRNA ligase family protein [Planctomycetota bacterium]